MVAAKRSVSFTVELASALAALASSRGEDLSRLIETLLREHTLVRAQIERSRAPSAPPPELKKGRELEKLLILAEQARRRFDRRIATGQVRPVDTGE